MKRLPIVFSMAALLLTATLMLLPSAFAQQDPAAQQPTAQQGHDPAASQTMNQPSAQSPDAQTFMGKISKAGGKYVLKDDVSKQSYTLDDQERAKKFEGQSVKVTGKLDAATNTIQVAAIEPGS